MSLHGRKGLIVGIANEHSIAYGCARVLRDAWAELAITYLNAKAEPYVRPLAMQLDSPIIVPCDVREPGQLKAVFSHIRDQWSRLDFLLHSIAYVPPIVLVETLLANGIGHVALTDWKSATEDMKDLEIDNYLAEVIIAIDDLGGRVNLVGLCQGGWVAAMVAARFPDKVSSLVLAGAPIDTDAGDGPIKRMVHESPAPFYEEMVALGGGLMKGKYMFTCCKAGKICTLSSTIFRTMSISTSILTTRRISKRRRHSRAGTRIRLTRRDAGIFR
jgi:hypothetical protein